eukprot:758816-Hanusia_phi.AAC.1
MKRNPSTEDLTTCGEKPKVEEEKRNGESALYSSAHLCILSYPIHGHTFDLSDDENFSRSCSVESIKEVSDENERLKKRVHELEKVLLGNKSTNTNDAAANDDEAARDPKIPYHSEIHGCIEVEAKKTLQKETDPRFFVLPFISVCLSRPYSLPLPVSVPLLILSVDDNEVNHMVVENILTPRGFKITTCMSGVGTKPTPSSMSSIMMTERIVMVTAMAMAE